MSRRVVPLVCAWSATAGALARAQELPPPAAFSGSTSARLEWHADNHNERDDDDDYGDLLVRTNLALDGGDTRIAMRIDGEGFVARPATAAAGHRNDLRIERISLDLDRTHAPGGHQVRSHLSLGDFYAQLGRGLALSLRRVDELGIDVALRGARIDLGVLDGHLTLTLLGGVTNVVNIDQQYLHHLDEPRDPLGGARLEGRLGDLTTGLHVVGVRDGVTPMPGVRRQSLVGGATVDATLGDASLSFELDGQRRALSGTTQDGWAAYAVATVSHGRLTLLAEAKHYVHFAALTGSPLSTGEGRFVYNQPPTAERIDQELVDNTDVTGGRLRADVSFGEDASHSLHGNLGLHRNRATHQWVSHAFGGLDLRAPSGRALLVAAGYRREWMIDGGALARAIAHGELDAMLPVLPRFSLHAIARHESHVEANGPSRYVFHRGGASLEADLFDRLVVAAGADWDTQNQNPGIARGFGFGLIRWRHSDAFILQLLAGSQRGGIRCIAGACRIQPPFAGARLDVTAFF